MKKNIKQTLGTSLGILLLLILAGYGAYHFGQMEKNPVYSFFNPPSPTPTPDPRNQLHQPVPFSNLNLTVDKIWRIEHPQFPSDIGMAIVTFHANKKCHRQTEYCAFDRSQFRLFDATGKEFGQSNPPSDYVPGMRFIHLVASRKLSGGASETGQVFFLIDKNTNDYTLQYTDANGITANFTFQPPTYAYLDYKRNLMTTPFPTIIHLDQQPTPSVIPTIIP